ncbi:hypothetical protein DX908_08785 [Parvularcula marina]|uniref:Uncharacterized protein n=2 Tax=Parvularcula marina TaxID=2292771 RepID=A0A371RLT1_9PROT|nr:hypothetical protein DX908_08785 [Parvularcula marina]
MMQEPEAVANYRDWTVYKAEVGGDTVCYAVTEPTDRDPAGVDHGEVYFAVSTWKSGKAAEQPSLMAGYDLRERPKPLVRIGSNRWDMFTAGDEAFIETDGDESRLVGAMKRGSDMRISAMSERGTNTEYSFSLYGITNALERAARECR